MEKYLVIEIQTNAEGIVSSLVTKKEDYNEALSAYYYILAAASVSELPVHAAVLMTNEGITLEFRNFVRVEEEPED